MSAAVEQEEAPSAEEIEEAAVIAHAGLDLVYYVDLADPLKQAVWLQVARRVLERRADEREELARLIRHHIVEAFG